MHEELHNLAQEKEFSIAGIILAAGQSKRFGSPKQLLSLHGEPFIRQIAMKAIRAGLSPVMVITGAVKEEIEQELNGLPVVIIHNPVWIEGQSTSIRVGVKHLPETTGGAIFMLSDQPMIPETLIRSLVEVHVKTLAKIIAPEVDGRRANPVLFDKQTFPELMRLVGDTGGRALFSKYRVLTIPWNDPRILMDIDSPEDYRQLLLLE
jgi:molybdenum cofactor cytidylyltransferase